MSEADHRHWEGEIAAYLLGALEPGEAAGLERHVAGCVDCQADLRRLRPAVDMLAESVERVDLPDALRTRLIEQARGEAAQTASAPERQTPFGRRRWFSAWRPAVGFTAVALIAAAVAGYAIRGGDSGGDATTVVAGRPPAVTAQLTRLGDSGMLRLANLHQLPGDKVLEAWVQRDGEVERAGGLFVPDRAGRATAMIPDMHGVEAVMVTSEPEGGSAQPTSSPMVMAKIETG
jgi:anti-sigma-K factor RskA